MPISLKLSHKALVLITVPLISEAAILGGLAFALNKAETEANKQIRSKAVITDADQLLIKHWEGAMSLFLYNRSQSASNRERFLTGLTKAEVLLDDLKRLTNNNADEASSVAEIESGAKEARDIVTDLSSQMDRHEDKFERGRGNTELQLKVFLVMSRLKRGISHLEDYEEGELAKSGHIESNW
jgi:hypothetical protein